MSHIPAKAMPHARAHHDDDTPPSAPRGRKAPSNALPITAFALGGLATIGAIAAAVYYGTRTTKPKPPRHKRRKPA